MTLWGIVGLAALVASLLGLVVWLSQRNGKAKAEKIAADHMTEAIENAAKMRRTAEDVVRSGGDGTASDGLRDWLRD